MKTTLILIVFSLALAGCKSNQSATTRIDPNSQTQTEVANEFGSIATAIAEGKPVSCTMTKTDGSSSMQYVIKQKKMKVTGMESQGASQNSVLVSDGEYLYSWDSDTKQGFKMKLPSPDDVESIAKQKGQSVPTLESEDDKKKFEDQGYTVDCAITMSIADAEFIPPADVKFSDFSTMMEDSQKMMQQLPKNIVQPSMEE